MRTTKSQVPINMYVDSSGRPGDELSYLSPLVVLAGLIKLDPTYCSYSPSPFLMIELIIEVREGKGEIMFSESI